ncbi:hypothetical protein [Tenuifilum osseticum]|uniref:hypothetical protein n=1 Tax=Tenuifilum osseticum TaxID=3374723 RepID=UPI0034E42B7B
MKKSFKLLTIICLLVAVSYSNGQKCDNQSVAKSFDVNVVVFKTEKPLVQNQKKYFKIKCGYVKYSMLTAGQELIREWWFDDYGNKQYEESYMIIGGEKSGDKTLIIDGFQYKWQFDATNGTKMKYYQAKTDYDNITEREIQRYGIKKHGFEEYLGKNCLKVSTEKPKSISWVWENIVLKSETEIAGQKVMMKATEINENQPAASLFKLPSGISFEMQ